MGQLPEKPTESVIVESLDDEAMTLSWPVPRLPKWFLIPAYGAFIYAYVLFWIQKGAQFVGVGGPGTVFLVLFIFFPIYIGWRHWKVLIRSRPESIRLQTDSMEHIPGLPNLQRQRRSWWQRKAQFVATPTEPKTMPRSEIIAFKLDRVGKRQRLFYDRGSDRLEVGACLKEPDREWLFAVLQRWHSPESAVSK